MVTTPIPRLRPARGGRSEAGLVSTTTVVRRIAMVLAVTTALLGTVIVSFGPDPEPVGPARALYVSPALGAVAPVALIKPLAPAPLAPPPAVDSGTGYLRPVGGEFLSGFGVRSDGMHTGNDLRGRTGEPILASQSGTVSGAACGSGYGICTMIDHGGGVTTLYAHMSVKVVAGGTVERGQVIGLVGCTGSCETPHVHFEVRLNGARVDPLLYL